MNRIGKPASKAKLLWQGIHRFLVGLALASGLSAEPERPHIILVMADDQGWGQVGYNGHPHLKTPHLDAMASCGIRFNRFYAAAPICSPTRASVLTGRIPGRTGVPGLHKRLCLQEKTLPQALRKAGYATAHVGKWHLGGVKGSGMPILPDDPNHPGHYGFDVWLSATNFFDMDPLMTRNGTFEYLEGETSELMVEEALKFIAEHRARPTFTVIWYGSPHFPFKGRAEDREGFPKGKHGDQLGEIVALDRSVGMLRKGLRDLGIEKNTLIWYTSDNGGLSTDPDSVGKLKGFKGSLNEGGIRVPGIIEWPDRVKPMVTDFPASTMDIMPTLIDLLNLPEGSLLAVHDGQSLVPLLKGQVPESRRPIPFTTKGTALIDGEFKLLMSGKGRTARWVLYNLTQDPGETNDVSAQHPERFEKMKAEVERVFASVQASAEGKDYPEGRVIQAQRGESWFEMKEYQRQYETFRNLKPGWEPPGTKKKSGRDDQ